MSNIQNVIEWAKSNHLDPNIFPYNKEELFKLPLLELDNTNIKDIPPELFELKSSLRILSLTHNQISSIPSNIDSFKACIALILCNNYISSIPESLYNLKILNTLCLSKNKLTSLSNDIQKLTNLTTLNISNNDIKELPKTISTLQKLSSIDIENTLIKENSLEFLQLENLERICFNDKLLPFFIKNVARLKNINTINFTHSNYKKEESIITPLNLSFNNEVWMSDDEDKGYGYILLSKK